MVHNGAWRLEPVRNSFIKRRPTLSLSQKPCITEPVHKTSYHRNRVSRNPKTSATVSNMSWKSLEESPAHAHKPSRSRKLKRTASVTVTDNLFIHELQESPALQGFPLRASPDYHADLPRARSQVRAPCSVHEAQPLIPRNEVTGRRNPRYAAQ